MKIRALAGIVILLTTGQLAAAGEFNGRISGTIDGRSFDVAVVCSDLPGEGWFMVISDPNHMNSATDRNGDGIAIVVNGSIAGGTTTFNASLDDKKYNFGGKEGVLTEHGLTFKSEMHRMNKDTRKFELAYEVDLEIDCSGPPAQDAE